MVEQNKLIKELRDLCAKHYKKAITDLDAKVTALDGALVESHDSVGEILALIEERQNILMRRAELTNAYQRVASSKSLRRYAEMLYGQIIIHDEANDEIIPLSKEL